MKTAFIWLISIALSTTAFAQTAEQVSTSKHNEVQQTMPLSATYIETLIDDPTTGCDVYVDSLLSQIQVKISNNIEHPSYSGWSTQLQSMQSEFDSLQTMLSTASSHHASALAFSTDGVNSHCNGQYWAMQPPDYSGDYYFLVAVGHFNNALLELGMEYDYLDGYVSEIDGGSYQDWGQGSPPPLSVTVTQGNSLIARLECLLIAIP